MDVVPLVEAAPRPERTAVQRRHVAPLGIHLVHPREAVFPSELGRVAVFVVELRHAFNADLRTIDEPDQVLAQVQFDVLLTLVTQAILGLRAWQLEAGLGSSALRSAHAAAHIAGKL
ncbi:hypothetical protein D9M69_481640 [compost metagenome]